MTNTNYTAPKLRGFDGKKAIDFEISDACDIDCFGCFTKRGKQAEEDIKRLSGKIKLLTSEEITDVIKKASALGFETVASVGHGEPTINKERFWSFIDSVNKYGLIPAVATHGLWVSPEDAKKLYDNNVTVVAKLWSLDKEKNAVMLRHSPKIEYVQKDGVFIPEGLFNLLNEYGSHNDEMPRMAINTVVNSINQNEVLEILAFIRSQKGVLPYMEFMFASGNSNVDPTLWLDKQGGETLMQTPSLERSIRHEIYNAVVKKDKELGFTYYVPEDTNMRPGKVGQNTFDNKSTLVINPFGYSPSCPARADFRKGEKGNLLNVRDSLAEIVKIHFEKKACGNGSPCAIGGYTCLADKDYRIGARLPIIN